jgi:protein-disulfide isomerase
MINNKHILSIFIALGVLIIIFFGYDVLKNREASKPEFDFSGIDRPIKYSQSPTRGNNRAQIVMYEYGDYNCPGCKSMQTVVNDIFTKYQSTITHVWKDFPFLSDSSTEFAIAARCAGEQDKFWEYHDWLFQNQSNIDSIGLVEGAAQLGLNKDRFTSCLLDDTIANLVEQDFAEARALGVNETPTIIVGGTALVGVQEFGDLENIIINAIAQP